jgi:hypothetical protein
MAEQAFALLYCFSYHVFPECGGQGKFEGKVAFWFPFMKRVDTDVALLETLRRYRPSCAFYTLHDMALFPATHVCIHISVQRPSQSDILRLLYV